MAKKKKKPIDKTAAARQGTYRSKNVTITLPKEYLDTLVKLAEQYRIEAKTPTDLRRSVVIRLIETAGMVTSSDSVTLTEQVVPEVVAKEDKPVVTQTLTQRPPKKKLPENNGEENLSLFDLL